MYMVVHDQQRVLRYVGAFGYCRWTEYGKEEDYIISAGELKNEAYQYGGPIEQCK